MTVITVCPAKLPLLMLLAAIISSCMISMARAVHWQHAQQLSEDFRLLWSVNDALVDSNDGTSTMDKDADSSSSSSGKQDITFEVQARTHGYIGLGFARPGDRTAGADVVIGWVDGGQTYLQDRHFKKNGHREPAVDASQDYTLLLGYENRTHTVLRFRRRLDACTDLVHDVAITPDTQSVFYMLHAAEPINGSVAPGALPDPQAALSQLVPMQLTQRTDGGAAATALRRQQQQQRRQRGQRANAANEQHTRAVDLRNGDVTLPMHGETLQWCRVFELAQFAGKHHIVRFEPVFDAADSRQLMDEIVLYECQGDAERLRSLAAQPNGQLCVSQRVRPTLPCAAIVAAWRSGSTGLTFPPEAGFPVDSNKERFYLMETQYSNRASAAVADSGDTPNDDNDDVVVDQHQHQQPPQTDNSGLRLHVTSVLRPNDAGVLSLGIHPEWRHIIPPGHERVISEGHCVADCTRPALSAAGISIFAVLPQTRHIATQVRLRQVRSTEDMAAIAADRNVHSAYAEYRAVEPVARVLPGDQLIVECTFDSSARESITLGGTAAMSETCQMLAVYWPRQRRLTTCHSLPSLPTVLHALGIEELTSTSPVLIASPAPLAGITLESRILSYDWAGEFDNFQRATLGGSFQAFCTDARHKAIANTDTKEYFRPRVTKMYTASVNSATGTTGTMCPTTAADERIQPSVIVAVPKPKRHQPLTIVDVGEAALIDSMGNDDLPAASAAASTTTTTTTMTVTFGLTLLPHVLSLLAVVLLRV